MWERIDPFHGSREIHQGSGVGQITTMQQDITRRYLESMRVRITNAYEASPFVRWRRWYVEWIVFHMYDCRWRGESNGHCGGYSVCRD